MRLILSLSVSRHFLFTVLSARSYGEDFAHSFPLIDHFYVSHKCDLIAAAVRSDGFHIALKTTPTTGKKGSSLSGIFAETSR